MSRPYLLAQISDLHVGSDWEGIEPLGRIERVIGAVLGLPNPVDAVLVSGDLAGNGAEEEYRVAAEMLGRFDVPVHVLPGNHDDRLLLRRFFDLPGEGDAPIDYAVDAGPLRLVALDSTIPGQDPGGFEAAQLRWLDAELSAHAGRPTLLALHHPPLGTGIPDWDRVNLSVHERETLAAVIARHPQVLAIAGGHLHRAATATLAGRPVLAAPAVYLQALPDFETEEVEMNGSPPGFALHVLRGAELSSQVETLAP